MHFVQQAQCFSDSWSTLSASGEKYETKHGLCEYNLEAKFGLI